MKRLLATALLLWGCDDAKDEGQQPPSSTGSTTLTPGCVPNYDCDPQAPDTNDFAADCVARVNQFRACVCLPPLERATDAEACVNQQAEYDASNGAHAGFLANLCQPRASAQNECPGWGGAKEVVSGCIRQMFTEGPPPTADCTGDCYTQHGHFINMTNTRYTKLACGIFSNQSETWSAQNFF